MTRYHSLPSWDIQKSFAIARTKNIAKRRDNSEKIRRNLLERGFLSLEEYTTLGEQDKFIEIPVYLPHEEGWKPIVPISEPNNTSTED